MFRLIKWAAPLAAIALLLTLASVQTARADDKDTKKETGKITGTVTDKDGKPAVGAEVGVFHPMGKSSKKTDQAEKPTKEKPISVVPEVKTDDKGEFTLENVPVGDYTVVARLRGSGTGRENVTFASGETAKVEIKLGYKATGGSKAPAAGSEKPASDKQ